MLLGTGVPGLVAVPRQPEGPFAKVLGPAAGAGAGTGPHLRERVGHYFREGELICVVEEPAVLEAEVIVAEEEVAGVEPGQRVLLKARALPFETFPAKVVRVAPGSLPGESQNAVAVYCRVDGAPAGLRPGMSGYGRIYTCPCSLGEFLARRALRFLRTEFWWAAGAG